MTRFITLFLTGAVGYGAIEILWRGYTHWTMLLLGGICFYILFIVFSRLENASTLTKAIIGGGIITAAEFVTGCIVNLILKWNVWSYKAAPYNLLGQICLRYTLFWIILSVPLVYLCKLFKKYI